MKAMQTKFDEMNAEIYTRFDLIRSKAADVITNDDGAIATEYALVIGVVVVGIVGAASAMYEPLGEFFKSVVASLY